MLTEVSTQQGKGQETSGNKIALLPPSVSSPDPAMRLHCSYLLSQSAVSVSPFIQST